MKLITKEVQKKLDDNMKLAEEDRQPVVKFFGGGACNWFISEMDGNILYGLCDLGLGYREFGTVYLSELESLKFQFGGVERDMHWTPQTFDELLKEHKDNGGY
mgnify:FL=1|tara:strand:+ start:223 stop:531 length:309 start_codon:yes stop_codon:yes gene_type:complete